MVRNCSAVCLVSGQVLHLWEFISLTSTPVFCPCSQDLSQKDTIRKCWPVKCLFHTVSVPAAKSLKLHCCLCYLSFSGQIPAGMIKKKCTEGSAVAAETAVVQSPPWDFLPRTHFRSPEEFFLYIFFPLIPCSKLSFGSHPFFTWLFIPVVRVLLCLTVLLVSRLAAQDHWLQFVSWQRWRSEPTLRRAWYFSPSFVAFWECTLEVLTLFHQLEVFACLMVLAFRMLMNPVCLKDTEKRAVSLCHGCSL